VVTASEASVVVSVGKLRSDADQAMVSGDVEKSIKLMNQVCGQINRRAVCLIKEPAMT
jgi:hypothetical protein